MSTDAQIYVAYSKSLETRNPSVAKFLSQIALDPAVVNQWILQIGRDKMDPRDVAEKWVKNNMDTVNKWIMWAPLVCSVEEGGFGPLFLLVSAFTHGEIPFGQLDKEQREPAALRAHRVARPVLLGRGCGFSGFDTVAADQPRTRSCGAHRLPRHPREPEA